MVTLLCLHDATDFWQAHQQETLWFYDEMYLFNVYGCSLDVIMSSEMAHLQLVCLQLVCLQCTVPLIFGKLKWKETFQFHEVDNRFVYCA